MYAYRSHIMYYITLKNSTKWYMHNKDKHTSDQVFIACIKDQPHSQEPQWLLKDMYVCIYISTCMYIYI